MGTDERRPCYSQAAPLLIEYKAVRLDVAYRLDMVVEDSLTVELKTVEKIFPIHEAQLLTYLRLAGIHTGLILNFRTPVLKDGIKRMKL